MILAPWDDEANFFEGSFHLECVRRFDRRVEFRAAVVDWITCVNDQVTVLGEDGQNHGIPRTGLGFTNLVAELPTGEIYEDPRFNQWVLVEYAGPFHFLALKTAEALGRGERVRGNEGQRAVVLPGDPGAEISAWSLIHLLDFLAVHDLYQPMLDAFEPDYEFWDGGQGRAGFILNYSLSALRPIPEDVSEFFRRYLPSYVLKRLEDA
ncbi:hypothetical protein [Nocardia sp.]|uniref:hypothetical protein n=1 Tax=Nocardia sp. TaxID=1821 RepID=UPI00260E9AF0|nr:hypothetical protein [Nocardia sp.]